MQNAYTVWDQKLPSPSLFSSLKLEVASFRISYLKMSSEVAIVEGKIDSPALPVQITTGRQLYYIRPNFLSSTQKI